MPNARAWIEVAGSEVVETRFLVQLLRGEEVRRALRVGVLLHPRLSKREVFQMLENLPIQISNIARRPQVIRVIVVLILLEDLRSPGRIPVAVSVAACVAVAQPVRVALPAIAVGPAPGFGATVRQIIREAVSVDIDHVGGLDQLRDQTRAAREDVLGADLAVPHGVELVDVGGLALGPALDDAFAGVVVLVGLGVAVVRDLLDAVLFVPDDGAAGAVLDVIPAGLVAVQVIGIGAVADEGMCVRSPQ